MILRSLVSLVFGWSAVALVPAQFEWTSEVVTVDNESIESVDAGLADTQPPQAADDDEKARRRQRLEKCLADNYTVTLNADKLRPWSIMHGALAFGQNATVVTNGHYVNSIDYLCANGRGDDRRILAIENDRLVAHTGPGLQGHEAQLLAVLAQTDVSPDTRLFVDDREFSLQDLIQYEQSTCRARSELTFKLMGLAHYVPSDKVWRDDLGQAWDISRLINEEISQPINGSACGGLHRLMGLSFALETRRRRGEPINGQWQRIAHFTQRFQQRAFDYQNPDGSFSTEWFDGPGYRSDLTRRIYTTGHTLEWLVFSLPDDQLQSPGMLKAVDAMIDMLTLHPSSPRQLHGLDVGPKGHALRALRLFEQRVYGQASDHRQLVDLSDRLLEPVEALKLQNQPAQLVSEASLVPADETPAPANIEPVTTHPVAKPVSHSRTQPAPAAESRPTRRTRFMRRR